MRRRFAISAGFAALTVVASGCSGSSSDKGASALGGASAGGSIGGSIASAGGSTGHGDSTLGGSSGGVASGGLASSLGGAGLGGASHGGASQGGAGHGGASQGGASQGGASPGTTSGQSGASAGGNSGNGTSEPVGGALAKALGQDDQIDAAGLIARFAPTVLPEPAYDPASIQGLDKIQGSSIALNADELSTLARRGFLISAKQAYPTFTYGYRTAYFEHLPVYISADSILSSIHRSYDGILKSIESSLLKPSLTTLLSGMRDRLSAGALAEFDANARADVDLYLVVALSLLGEQVVAPVAGADAARVQSIYDSAVAASGAGTLEIFGAARQYDFSQFKPRGHYENDVQLAPYFRAMMWLGRTDLRIIETREDGSQQFLRRQFDAVVALRTLVDATLDTSYQRIDEAVTTFVGEHDYMTLDEAEALLQTLGVASAADLGKLSDATIEKAILDGGYGTQRIASQIMKGGTNSTMPLARSFSLFGQRYVIDSEVFSNVVYDRVQGGKVLRMMPSPLDVAFSVFGNGQAAALLKPELDKYHYAPDLAHVHTLVENHGDDFWQGNLYNGWLSSLRTLSPAPATAPASATQGLSASMRTEAWGRRLLNAQLASWAELRHDTLLYAKQSYSAGNFCEFPDAYVDPYPEFFAEVSHYAALGLNLVARLKLEQGTSITPITNYFQALQSAAETLGAMAEHERTGQPLTSEMVDFINQAVTIGSTCGGQYSTGWYAKLFFGAMSTPVTFDPTIADVHTQPTDESGGDVGRVLHVGTGYARMMVVVAENCSGPRAYAGPVSSYYEQVTDHYDRLTDSQWSGLIQHTPPSDVPWMSDLVSH